MLRLNSVKQRECEVSTCISAVTDEESRKTEIDRSRGSLELNDRAGRVLTTQLSIDDSIYQTQSLYAPTTPAARPPPPGGTTQSAHTNGLTELQQLKQDMFIEDTWRARNPRLRAFTWATPNRLIHSRVT